MQAHAHIESAPIGRDMTDNECRCRIREASIARLRAFDDAPSNAVDVTYSLQGNTVFVQPIEKPRSESLPVRRSALLEIDHGSLDSRKRWRIIVTGQVESAGSRTMWSAGSQVEPGSTDPIQLRIHLIEGRHEEPAPLPPGAVVPHQRPPTS